MKFIKNILTFVVWGIICYLLIQLTLKQPDWKLENDDLRHGWLCMSVVIGIVWTAHQHFSKQ